MILSASLEAGADATWLLLLVAGYLQYYFMDVYAQIAALPRSKCGYDRLRRVTWRDSPPLAT